MGLAVGQRQRGTTRSAPVPGLVVTGSGSGCQFRVCSCVLGHCTRSVGNAPLLFGCSAPYRVQCPLSGVVPQIGCSAHTSGSGNCWGYGRLPRLECLLLGVLCGLVLWFLRNVACNSPVTISGFELVSLELQRFEALLKFHAIELHAKFLETVSAITPGCCRRTPLGHTKHAPDTHHSDITKPPGPIGAGRQWR